MSFLECETLTQEEETKYVTIPRGEYDELIQAEEKLSLLTAAIKADVLTSTLRRIVTQDEAAYRAGAWAGGILKTLAQGFSDSQTPDRATVEGAEAKAHFRNAAD